MKLMQEPLTFNATAIATNATAISDEGVIARATAVITNEADARTAGDATNATAIATNATAISGSYCKSNCYNKQAARTAGDATNATAIATNATRYRNKRWLSQQTLPLSQTNATAISDEVTARATAITNEADARTAGQTLPLFQMKLPQEQLL
jgi:hypothetical protein